MEKFSSDSIFYYSYMPNRKYENDEEEHMEEEREESFKPKPCCLGHAVTLAAMSCCAAQCSAATAGLGFEKPEQAWSGLEGWSSLFILQLQSLFLPWPLYLVEASGRQEQLCAMEVPLLHVGTPAVPCGRQLHLPMHLSLCLPCPLGWHILWFCFFLSSTHNAEVCGCCNRRYNRRSDNFYWGLIFNLLFIFLRKWGICSFCLTVCLFGCLSSSIRRFDQHCDQTDPSHLSHGIRN